MDPLSLSRWQFGLTTVYHFLFVPLTLGLGWFVAYMQTRYYQTKDESWRKMTKFWGKLFLINFAIGVVTGIVQEFQFGMNWSEYSRFVGDIFGAPLAIEALLAFFLESTFLGLWIFGWDKLSKGAHAAAIWAVAIGSNLSALWILIANSFMQEPMGYVLRNGRAEMTDFWALLANPHVWVQWPHVFFSGVTTAALFVMGISAWHLLRKSNLDFFRRSFQIALVYGLIGSSMVGLMGHSQAQHMVREQPMKMAAAEGLYQTENPASFSLITIGDLQAHREVFAIRIPALLSLLAYNQFTGEVKGIDELQTIYTQQYGEGDYRPPIPFIYWTFRLMVGAGLLMVLLALVGLFLALKGRLEITPWYLRLMPYALILPYVATSTGWLMTELGRQPWIVFGLMKTEQAVSPTVTWGMVLASLLIFTVLYGALMAVDIYLLNKYAKGGPGHEETLIPAAA